LGKKILAGAFAAGAALLSGSFANAAVLTGNIAVYDSSSNALLGYVGNSFTVFNTDPISSTLAGALSVQIDTSATAPFSILELNGPNSSYSYLGGAQGVTNFSTPSGYAFLTSVTSTGANLIGNPGESAIWTLSGNVLSAEWTNSDSTVVPLTLFHDVSFGDLDMAANLSSFVDKFGDQVEAVKFEFTGISSAVPEPSTWAMMILGFCGLGFMAYRKKQNGASLRLS
jgi:hypothetical protein